MANQLVKSGIHHHNSIQLDYYAGKVKKTMLPVDSYYVNNHIRQFIKHSGITREDDILEVGCGMGKFTFPLLQRGYKLTGLDLSPVLLQKLLEHNANRFQINLVASDILDAPNELNGRFDYVIGFFTLHHFMNLETYIKSMSRLLKPGGSIIFLEPNAYNPLYYFQIAFSPTMSWAGDKGVAMMHYKKFKDASAYAGLANLTIDKYGFFPPFVVNRKIGRYVESSLEKMRVFKGVSAFQIVKMTKPASSES
ncbi:hypothetical protein GCM10022393_41450 [Aquimarina addita]|uniref:Methyltransferase domain-containing protein n=1 Tax=Aquimarina addita TaxID=870485 RepID=A0ABP6UU38_9FLAO